MFIPHFRVFNLSQQKWQKLAFPLSVKLVSYPQSWGKILRRIFLGQMIGKVWGMMTKSSVLSWALIYTGICQLIFPFLKPQKFHTNLNHVFAHRHPRFCAYSALPHEWRDGALVSPNDAYLHEREVQAGKIALYPGLTIDLTKVHSTWDLKEMEGAKVLWFTLKPFHDHTNDYALSSYLLSPPQNYAQTKIETDSTDPYFMRILKAKVLETNQRVVSSLFSSYYQAPFWFIELGANMVNSIVQDKAEIEREYPAGTQKSHFNFGSTTILILSPKIAAQMYFMPYLEEKARGDNLCELERGDLLAIPKTNFSLNLNLRINANWTYHCGTKKYQKTS